MSKLLIVNQPDVELSGAPYKIKSAKFLQSDTDATVSAIKVCIWLYFILLMFEGALRKWFLPGLSTPLLLVRDPIAIWLIIRSWQKGLLPINFYLISIFIVGVIGVLTALIFGHGSLAVALFGARILILHFPIMYVIGRNFTRSDVLKLGKVTLWLAIPMTVLITIQFYSPQSAWVNRGVGGDMAGAGFSGALGYFRPPGTFSFTNGTTLFFSLASCFIFYFWFDSSKVSRLLLLGATGALLAAIPLSISRSLFYQVGLTFLFAILAISRKPKFLGHLLFITVGGILALSVLSQLSFFQTAAEAFTSRFDAATTHEGGVEGTLVERFLGGLLEAITSTPGIPFLGYGIGMGTNVGSMILAGGMYFLISEGEWGRLIGELGPLMGLAIVWIRLNFVWKLSVESYKKVVKADLLPWMLLSFGIIIIPQGQWAQPTSLGFSTLIGGLLLASLSEGNKTNIGTKR